MTNAPPILNTNVNAPSSDDCGSGGTRRPVLRSIGAISILIACASGLFNLLALPLALTLCGAAWLQVLWPPTPPGPVAPPSPIATTLSLLATASTLGLAIFLLIAGVITLRESLYSDPYAPASGARLHRWYALLKIPLVLLETALAVWLWHGSVVIAFEIAWPAGAPAWMTSPTTQFALNAFAPALLALVYPLALLGVLRPRAMRRNHSVATHD